MSARYGHPATTQTDSIVRADKPRRGPRL